MNYQEIGQFIKKQRLSLNLTQEELANRLYVSAKAISKWENGRGFPSVEYLMPLTKELQITVNELIAGKKIEEKEKDAVYSQIILNFLEKRKNKKWLMFFLQMTVFLCFMTISILLYASGMDDFMSSIIFVLLLIICAVNELSIKLK